MPYHICGWHKTGFIRVKIGTLPPTIEAFSCYDKEPVAFSERKLSVKVSLKVSSGDGAKGRSIRHWHRPRRCAAALPQRLMYRAPLLRRLPPPGVTGIQRPRCTDHWIYTTCEMGTCLGHVL
eukprot:234833-Pleurochrysis_carterae.AAC.1